MRLSDPGPDHERNYVGPFLTWIAARSARDGSLLQTSRRARKGLAPLEISSTDADPRVEILKVRHDWLRSWAPQRPGWWIGILFMVGSALFAIGGAMVTWPQMPLIRSIDGGHMGWIFFIGSLFFTAAGYLQWLEVINGDLTGEGGINQPRRRWLFYGWRPRNLGYLAAASQLIGMLFFNINTADAFIAGLDWVGEDLVIWTPNMIGSICFLIASYAAILEVSHRLWTWQFHNLSWWITAVNMLGSIFFMCSAVGSFVEPGHTLYAPWLSGFGTFAGAICFFVGGYLLIPEQLEKVTA